MIIEHELTQENLKEAIEVVKVILGSGKTTRLSELSTTHVLVYVLLGEFLLNHYCVESMPGLLFDCVDFIKEAERKGFISTVPLGGGE